MALIQTNRNTTQSTAQVELNKKPTVFNTFKRDYQLWLLLLPAVLCVIIFNYVPMYGIQLAFREYDFAAGLTGGEFVGFKYFQQFIDSHLFTDLIRNTIVISLTTILVGFPAPIILALLINQIRFKRTKKLLQTTVYLPHFISIVVIVGMINVLLSPNSGVVGHFMSAIGLGHINLLASTQTFVPVYVLSDVWQHVGWNSIIYLAALASVDPQLYDSAKMDGASRWQIIRNVELPAIVPTIIILLILNMGTIISTGFEKIYLMQNPLNLPVSEVIETYVYKVGIMSSQFSYAAAIGLFNTVINFSLLVLMNYIANRTSKISLW
ncbi:sugar ABC transporter permease [Halalkalibacter sp. APA_J-10(15)]|uniref:ABC transporter permease n=1 Tax=unclassified Halalkalibacter TaxID=2893063 RepID=UPI001FF314F9|nr:ABC transporter permease subunit [Halalkalibacter sp. APA_J-10(15)]MCK0471997.1 ABC transporter permease subunit [Halalkalibacter sp. APA_J-10(15)]